MPKKTKKGMKRKPKAPAVLRLNSANAPLRWREDCPFWEWGSQFYALFILTVFPLLFGSEAYANITKTKAVIFAVVTCLYILFCALIGFVYRPGRRAGKWQRERTRTGLTLPQIILCAYVLWAVISTVASPYSDLFIGQKRYEGLYSILLYCTVFLLLSFWGEYTDAYVYGLGIMGAVLGFIAVMQSFGSDMLYPANYNYWNSSFLTTIGHEDCVAGIVCILVPALLCGYVILQGKWRQLCLPAQFFLTYITVFTDVDTAKIGFLIVALMLPCLIQSRDRLQKLLVGWIPILLGLAFGYTYHRDRSFAPGAAALVFLLAAAASGALAWYMSRRERTWPFKPSAIRRVMYLFLAVVFVIALISVYGYDGDNRLMREVSNILHGELSDTAGSLRGYIWKSTLKIIRERPVLGGGPGSFYSLFAPFNEGYRALMNNASIYIDFPHNDLLNVAACTGLVGLALYLAFLITLAARCIRRAERSPVLLIFLAGMAGYLVYSFFVFSIAIVSPLFWVMAGLADKCVRQTEAAAGMDAVQP